MAHGLKLFGFVSENIDNGRPHPGGKRVAFPKQFSFIENPDETIRALAHVAAVSKKRIGRKVHLDQSPCTLLDYGAEAVAGVIARAARDGHGVRFHGTYPEGEEELEIAMAAGLPKLMGADVPNIPFFRPFPLHHGRQKTARAHASDERDRVSDGFARYLDACLVDYGIGLSDVGLARVLGLLSEVIGNSEDHGQRPDWWLGGYLRRMDDEHGDCHIALFNFGETIARSMKRLPEDSMLREQIERLAGQHVRKRFFGTHFGEDELWTLYALQAGASRFQTSPTEMNSTRGQGLADMITLFQELGGTARDGDGPRMCLVSGSTYIRFEPRLYPMRERQVGGGESRRIIAFNDTNDLTLPPNPHNVRRLRAFFPGTVISLSLYLDRTHLRQLHSSENGNA